MFKSKTSKVLGLTAAMAVVAAVPASAESIITAAEAAEIKTDVIDTMKVVLAGAGLALLGYNLAAKAIPKIINKFF